MNKSIIMKCKTCQKKVSSNADVCPHCGEKLNFTEEEIQQTIQTSKKNSLIIRIFILIIAIIVLVFTLTNSYFSTKDKVYNRQKNTSNHDYTYTVTIKEN